MSTGGALYQGNSKLFTGPLGVVKIGFRGYDLGKTTADTNIQPDQDIKDIIYQQDGTKAADHVRTGIDYILNVTFGEIKTGLLVEMQKGITTQNSSTSSDSGTISRSVYQSMRDGEAGALRIVSVDEFGIPSTSLEDIMAFYEAIAIIPGDLVNWGADTQRNLAMQFRLKFHIYPTAGVYSVDGAFGYWGDPTTENVLPVTWPDLEAPALVSATATSATNIDVVFDENIAFQSAYATTHYVAKVDGVFVDSTAGSISTTTLSLTFPAATFASGDVIELSISELALEDTAATANVYGGVDGQAVTNSVP